MSKPSKVQHDLDKKIVEHYTALDAAGKFLHPPATDDELYNFIRSAYGIKLPRKVITEGHKSPFSFVADMFFERVKNALGFANRSGGKTFAVALLNHLDMTFKHRCEIASAGAVKDQAEKCYRYFQDFCRLEWFQDLSIRYSKVAGKPLYEEAESIRARTVFGNDARLEVITGSEKGLRGPHPHKARIDEIDLIEWQVLQTGLSMAHSGDGIRGQNVFTSTRQLTNGSMQRMLDEAGKKGISIYEWNIWEALSRCTRRCENDPKFGSCPIFTFCEGKAHNCDGFYSVDDFIDKVRVLDRETFETEWLNLRPAMHKMVYHMLGQKHVVNPDRLHQLTGVRYPHQLWRRICGLDFGSSPGHPFVYLKFCQLPNGAWMLFHEYIAEQKLIRDHAEAIRRSPYFNSSETIYADWDVQDRMELKEHGVYTKKAIKGANSVVMGIDYICSLLRGFPPVETPMLYIWHDCTYSFWELTQYAWPMRPDGKPDKSGNPQKDHDHVSDAMRMALHSERGTTGQKYFARTMKGI